MLGTTAPTPAKVVPFKPNPIPVEPVSKTTMAIVIGVSVLAVIAAVWLMSGKEK